MRCALADRARHLRPVHLEEVAGRLGDVQQREDGYVARGPAGNVALLTA
jgi:hypothetical protein